MVSFKGWQSLLTISTCSAMLAVTAGCATVSTGLQSGDLPPTGAFVAENGMVFNVQPLNYATLPASSSYAHDAKGVSANQQTRIRQLVRSSTPQDYQISTGDVLSINMIGYPEITPPSTTNSNASNPYAAGYPVDQQGYIQFPLIGRIKASGMSVVQFTNSLQSRLQRYLRYPDPQVKVVNYRGNKFFIDGEVRQPGEFSIADAPVSLYSALSMAGGATPDGDSNSIELIRNGERYELGLRDLREMGLSASQIYLRDGDSIHVNSQDRNKVYILGEFGQVEPVEIPEQGLSLAHVLGQSRGLNSLTADAAKVYIVRDHGMIHGSQLTAYDANANYDVNTSPYQASYDGAIYPYTDIYYVNLKTVTNLALANRFDMQPNDIVYVDATGLTRWSRFINSILPSTSAIRQLSGL